MSLSLPLACAEAGILIANLPGEDDQHVNLRTRLSAAEAAAESQGQPTFSLLLAPMEQGLLLGALSDVSCRIAANTRARLGRLLIEKLAALGLPQDF